MSIDTKKVIDNLKEGIIFLNEVRQNLADMDISDELLTLTDNGLEKIKQSINDLTVS